MHINLIIRPKSLRAQKLSPTVKTRSIMYVFVYSCVSCIFRVNHVVESVSTACKFPDGDTFSNW